MLKSNLTCSDNAKSHGHPTLYLFSEVSHYTNKNYYNPAQSPIKHFKMLWY